MSYILFWHVSGQRNFLPLAPDWQRNLADTRILPYRLPAPFLPRPVAEAALDRLTVALAPSGNLVVGLYAVPTDKAGAALTALRVARSGGHLWDVAEIERQLRARGFVDVETCHIPPTTFVLGMRP